MKKILLIAAMAVMLCSCGKKNSYTITGNVTGLEGTVTLMNDAGDDIAEAIAWAAQLPAHMNVNEMVLMPSQQAGAYYTYRKNH